MNVLTPVEVNFVPFARPDITELEIDAVGDCLRSGWLTSGAVVKQFEQAFASFIGVEHAVAVSSATMASLLLLEMLHMSPSDEVVVPAWTFSGPAMMAHKLGAKVVLCDVDPVTMNMTPATLEKVISHRTKVVMPTHFAGRSCDMKGLHRIAHKHGLWLIDDAAHAMPSCDRWGHMVGLQGAAATFFSFYATKALTTGDGGMVVTGTAEIANRLRRSRLHGFSRDVASRYSDPRTGWSYDVAVGGWKANMTDIAAALGLVQLDRQHVMLARRRAIANRYDVAFQGLQNRLALPPHEPGHAWHLYPVVLAPPQTAELFITAMAERGVQCSVHFIPLQKHSFWERYAFDPTLCPTAMALHGHVVSLPIYSSMLPAQVEQVIAAVHAVMQAH